MRYEDRTAHAESIAEEARSVVERFRERQAEVEDFDPKLILKIELGARVPDEDFERAGLRVLDSGDRSVAVVFADNQELTSFHRRLGEYQQGQRPAAEPEGELRSAAFESFFDSIDHLRSLTPEDRISPRLLSQLDGDEVIVFDVEVWFVSDPSRREEWMEEVRSRVEETNGEVVDEFVSTGAGVALARCFGQSATVTAVAELDQVALVDTIPQPRFDYSELDALQDIGELEVTEPPDGAPVVGVIDSGVRSGHPLLEPAVLEAAAIHPEFGGAGRGRRWARHEGHRCRALWRRSCSCSQRQL